MATPITCSLRKIRLNYISFLFVLLVSSFANAPYSYGSSTTYPVIKKLPTSRLKAMVLKPPFTLIFRVTITPARANRNQQLSSPQNLLVTLSAKGTSLLLKEQDFSTKVLTVRIWQDGNTFCYSSNSMIAQVFPGNDPAQLPWCPMPALGLPGMPLAINTLPNSASLLAKQWIELVNNEPKYLSKKTSRLHGLKREASLIVAPDRSLVQNQNVFQYVPGIIGWVPQPDGLQLRWMAIFGGSMPQEVWEFTDYKAFQGHWLASKFRFSQYYTISFKQAYLLRFADYQLVSATEDGEGDQAYDISYYFSRATFINDYTDSTKFTCYPNQGVYSQQKRRQLMLANAAKSNVENGNVLSRSRSGIFLAFALIFGCAAWAFRRWRKPS